MMTVSNMAGDISWLGSSDTSSAVVNTGFGGTPWVDYHWYPSYSYPVIHNDRVAELKAWLDGYCTDRKMTEKALKRIKAKIEEFSDE